MANKRKTRAALKKEYEARKRRERIILMLVIAGVILLFGGILILTTGGKKASPMPTQTTKGGAPIVNPTPVERKFVDRNVTGKPDAPVTIIEYSDFQCPFCDRFATQTEPLIVKNYVNTGKVRFVFRSFGNWIGPESLNAAEAAYCAGDQGKFWQMHDILFANRLGENVGSFTIPRILKMAEAIHLNMGEFKKCLMSHKYQQQAMQDLKDGKQAGVKGTPSFVIIAPDGSQELIVGALPYSDFQKAIEKALAKGKKQ